MGTATVASQHDIEVDGTSLESAPVPAPTATATSATSGATSASSATSGATSTAGVVRVVTGHYGSGKTEFSVSLAMHLAAQGRTVALGDLDVVNPYFRSREQAALMTAAGIRVISSSLGHDAAIDLPAISPEIRSPLADPACDVILDVGGNEAGARVLVEFGPDLRRRGHELLLVVNAYRPDTRDLAGVLRHLRAIEDTCGLTVGGLVSNTHVCRDTTVSDVVAGYRLTDEVSRATGIPIRYVCAIPTALDGLADDLGRTPEGELLPIGLYLRAAWM